MSSPKASRGPSYGVEDNGDQEGISWNVSGSDNFTSNGQGRGRHQRSRSVSRLRRASLAKQLPGKFDILERNEKDNGDAAAARGAAKLGTFSGVFVPTTLNVLSILMFLRFGFILGQSGVFGIVGMLISAYMINLITIMSISAIATNGTVRGGGAYYLISRSLGAEFGGSIGIVFYLGCVLNTGMNAVGLVDCFIENFGSVSGIWANILLEGFWWQYLWATIVLILCTSICLAGSSAFSRASHGLLAILLVATFSIPLSPLIKSPFINESLGIEFTGFRLKTLVGNLKPGLTEGAAGSLLPGKENFQNLFGILFPATSGIFAGASMSGDLKDPSKSIPKGTLSGLSLTFCTYIVVILGIAASVTRESLYNDVNIIQDTNFSGSLIVLGEFATSFFSSLMGVTGAAKILQAIARDTLLPGLSIFGQGTAKTDGPVYAIIFTFLIAQLTILFDINRIASFISMAYFMTFLVTNLACFLLKVGSAPNFRPSFHYFNSWTALAGTIISGVSMFFVDGIYASACVCVLILLFLLIHYTSPPKPWGDVSQSLIYHQVRKYLLRLRPEHVKFWRPQILLFVDDFESQYKMISFCNSLKKGGLFVLGRVIVSEDFAGAVQEARREQTAWTKFIEYSRVKAFTNISVAPSIEWGIRNIALSSGLGGMRPNMVVIDQFRDQSLVSERQSKTRQRRDSKTTNLLSPSGDTEADIPGFGTDMTGNRPKLAVQNYLAILEDLLFKLRINVAIARGFENLQTPNSKGQTHKKYIDLWPIQMSAEVSGDGPQDNHKFLTTNFDTYTLILQLGCILHTVPSWKGLYRLRVVVFVEYETDVEEERGRVVTLLEKLRIEADVLVFWLACGDLQTYRIIVNGEKSHLDDHVSNHVETVLDKEDWWRELRRFRQEQPERRKKGAKPGQYMGSSASSSSSEHAPSRRQGKGLSGLKKMIASSKRRMSVGSTSVNFGMQTHRLLDSMVLYHSENGDDDSSTDDSDFDPYFSESEEDYEDNSPHNMGHRRQGYSDEDSGPSLPRSGKNKNKNKSRETSEDEGSATPKAEPSASTPSISTTSEDISAIERHHTKAHTQARAGSSAKFTSSPIPVTKIADEEGAGPSIMFANSPPGRRQGSATPRESIYTRQPASAPDVASLSEVSSQASGYPFQASVPLSFNDLPCRAQHLILNDLIKSQSKDTAVVFTTLPTPTEGIWRDESASESYVSDLEVLCDGLPPCLLVHSNSVTVTMNL